MMKPERVKMISGAHLILILRNKNVPRRIKTIPDADISYSIDPS
jgi:hypothetical protein